MGANITTKSRFYQHWDSLRLQDLKIVIIGTQYGYKREDGVLVIPIGSLKD